MLMKKYLMYGIVVWIMSITCFQLACTINSVAAIKPPISKPGCVDKCGSIEIPFPFGIGPRNCYVDEWFEIACNNSTTPHKPFLRRSNWEVLNISISDFTIQVWNPISYWNSCTGKRSNSTTTSGGLNLTGMPFFFTSSSDSFTVVGCGAGGFMLDYSNNNDSKIVSGCSPICSASNDTYFCWTGFPSLSSYQVRFEIMASVGKRDCELISFVADNKWLLSKLEASLDDIYEMDHVPVTLDWYLYNSDIDLFGANASNNSTIWTDSMTCVRSIAPSSINVNETSLTCSCSTGFHGNPFLFEGCLDINECEEHPKQVCDNDYCINHYGSYECKNRASNHIKILLVGIGSSIGALVLLLCIWSLYRIIKNIKDKKRKIKFFKKNGGSLLKQHMSSNEINIFNSEEIEIATDHFNPNRILGEGGQGTVYKGMLADGKIVAIKKSKVESEKIAYFINEIAILSQINHRNIVKLLGCCLETEVPLLVYEFISNGTLYHYIHHPDEEFQLTWRVLLQIASDIAGALAYLHSEASSPIYHRDIKSANILLDDKYRAKLVDFGTSRLIDIDKTHVTTQVCGTFGYLDPQYYRLCRYTDKSDVYSFGVLMVELLTRQKPVFKIRSTKQSVEEQHQNLRDYFIECMNEDRVCDIIDPKIVEEVEKIEDVLEVAILAKSCLDLDGRNRPTIKQVSTKLEEIMKSFSKSSASFIPQSSTVGTSVQVSAYLGLNFSDSSTSFTSS